MARAAFRAGLVVYLHGHTRPMVLAQATNSDRRWLCQWIGDQGQPHEAVYDVAVLSVEPAK